MIDFRTASVEEIENHLIEKYIEEGRPDTGITYFQAAIDAQIIHDIIQASHNDVDSCMTNKVVNGDSNKTIWNLVS